jgi:adenosylcobinamide-GDP ribazoletransferase
VAAGTAKQEPGAGGRETGAGGRETGAGGQGTGAGGQGTGAGGRETGAGKQETGAGTLATQAGRFCAAIRFLTILPVRFGIDKEQQYLSGSLLYFGPVGLLIGLISSFFIWMLLLIFPPVLVVVLGVVTLAAFSGFIHLDGLADTMDGLLGTGDRQRRLAIMRDSRIGVMGAAALIFVVLLKSAALLGMGTEHILTGLILAPIGGRLAIVISMAVLNYARPDGGLATLFYRENPRPATGVAGLLLIVALIMLRPGATLYVLIAFGVVLTLFLVACKKVFGGATGDTLGSSCELGELAVLVGLCGWVQ